MPVDPGLGIPTILSRYYHTDVDPDAIHSGEVQKRNKWAIDCKILDSWTKKSFTHYVDFVEEK